MGQSSGMNRFSLKEYYYYIFYFSFPFVHDGIFFPQLDGGKFSTIPHHHLSALTIFSVMGDSNISYVVFLSLNMIFYQSYALVNSLLE